MAKYSYELTGVFEGKGIIKSVVLGDVELMESDLAGNNKTFLVGTAKSNFGGKIAQVEKEHKCALTNVRFRKKGGTITDSSSVNNQKISDSRSSSTKLPKVLIGLGLILFVWMGYIMIIMLKGAYWDAPKKAIGWFKGFISK